ncbi:MAG: exodeoxyribonuclease VII large subunit [Bacillota bacterium]|nr:MAG: exodeoxyribonuclease VII large subunit [Bacillota bacterium]
MVSQPDRVWSVGELTARVRLLLEADPELQHVWVRGEISNYKHHSSGHIYFTLKDERAALRCVMFRSAARGLRFEPGDGMTVIAGGRIGVYEAGGQYQLYVEFLEPDGIGALYLAFEQLKERLRREGLFDPARKRPLPRLPRRVGVVTSADGAALRDIIRVASRRNPRVHLVVAPVPVQGEEAAPAIAAAIRRFGRFGGVDVLIVGRGGGSWEDLWPFNEEVVVRAVAESPIPVVSAVGHETDFTLCDLAADVRAPTPSAAAEMVIPDWYELRDRLADLRQRLERAIYLRVRMARDRVERLAASRGMFYLRDRVLQHRQRLDMLLHDLVTVARRRVEDRRQQLRALTGQLEALSPLAVLARGYSIARDARGHVVKDARDVAPGEPVEVWLHRGRLLCRVEETLPGGGPDATATEHGPETAKDEG